MNAVRQIPRRAKRIAAVAACALAAVGAGGTATASAAGPTYLSPGATVHYPTWGWGSTKSCAYNYHPYQYGQVGVSPQGAAYESFYVAPRMNACIDRWWWGNVIKVINIGSTNLTTGTR